MKKKIKKGIKQKMIIVPMMIIMLFNFIFPNYSQADWTIGRSACSTNSNINSCNW